MSALAAVATFLAAVQAQFLALTYQNNHSGLQKAVNVTSLLGIGFDVAGAALGLTSAFALKPDDTVMTQALERFTLAHRSVIKAKSEVVELKIFGLDVKDSQWPVQESTQDPRAMFEYKEKLLEMRLEAWNGEVTSAEAELKAICGRLIRNSGKGSTSIYMMSYGILFFFVSFICFTIENMPKDVWLPVLVIGPTLSMMFLCAEAGLTFSSYIFSSMVPIFIKTMVERIRSKAPGPEEKALQNMFDLEKSEDNKIAA